MQPNDFKRAISALIARESGSVTILFAASFLAMMIFVGVALDYSKASSRRQTMQTAADAAALAALSMATSDYAANASTTKMLADAQTAANGAFAANAGANYALLTATPTVTVQRNGQVVTATISYQAKSPNTFGQLLHVNQVNYTGSSASSMTLPGYLNFYLLLDVSESMGIPSTASEIERLAAINPDFLNLYPGGCTIACHFTNYQACQNASGATVWCQGYNLTRTAGNSNNTPVSYCPTPGTNACIQLRLDAVAYATQQLILTAKTTQTLTSQFGIGLYPFAAYMEAYQPLTTNLTTVTTAAAGLTGLIDNGSPTGVGSGGTHFENALTSINSTITTVGNGSTAAAPQPFVFLVTDGAQDNQYQYGGGNWSGSNSATTIDASNCTTLKVRGITVAVLYVPYVQIPNPTTIWNDEDGYANANIPYIPPALQSCASTGFFFTASAPSDITAAMQAMFSMAVKSSHLTQ